MKEKPTVPTNSEVIIQRLTDIRAGKEPADTVLVETLLGLLGLQEQKDRERKP